MSPLFSHFSISHIRVSYIVWRNWELMHCWPWPVELEAPERLHFSPSPDSITTGCVCLSDWCPRLQSIVIFSYISNSPLCLCVTSLRCTFVKSSPSSCFNHRLKSMITNVYSHCYTVPCIIISSCNTDKRRVVCACVFFTRPTVGGGVARTF